MIESGETAPSFTLPAVHDGAITELSLEEHLGEGVVILAFYPGDFNPACSDSETGLDELDLFTMQKDVRVLAISGDSVHSHRAFSEQYNLRVPLLSDTDGAVAKRYGVGVEDEAAGYLTHRAVFVIDHSETVQYAWKSEDPSVRPGTEEIRSAIEEIGDDETAESRSRVGHAHYMEGRRAFTSAMKAYEQREWLMAQTDFMQAAAEFDEAGEEFNTAARFAEAAEMGTYFERAETKSEALWRAADWLADSASAFASGEGAKGDALRKDAEAPLETARELHEPPLPDDFPPDEDPATKEKKESDDQLAHPLAEEEAPPASLDTDIETERAPTGGSPAAEASPTASDPEPLMRSASSDTSSDDGRQQEADDSEANEIDDAELEEITAELEEQTEAVKRADPEPGSSNVVPDELEPAGEDSEKAETVDLDLAEPEDDDDESEETSGDHGVPDSL